MKPRVKYGESVKGHLQVFSLELRPGKTLNMPVVVVAAADALVTRCQSLFLTLFTHFNSKNTNLLLRNLQEPSAFETNTGE